MLSQTGADDARRAAWRAYDALPAGVCVSTPAGEILHANPALHALLGYAPPALIGMPFTALDASPPVAPDSRHGAERPLRRRDGGSLWVVEAVASLGEPGVGGPDGEPLRLSVFTDVDERRRRETALRDRLLMKEVLFDTLPVPVFVKDVRGHYAHVNGAFERYTGLGRDRVLNQTTFAVLGPGAAKAHIAHDRKLLAEEGRVRYEEAVPAADGSLRVASLSKVAFRDSAGNPGGIVGIIHDLADHNPHQERLEAVLEQSPIGVSVSRRDDGRIVFVNTRFAELIGLPREQLVGSRARDYYLDEHQRERVLERLRGAGAVMNMEVQFRRADGSPFWTLFTVNQAVIQGVPVNLAWIYDYTERRSMEEALRDMASRDPLTGIYNRRSFMELARQQLARAHRFHEPLAVFVLDVDHFKRINDTYGHATGDDALRMVAGGCQAILREYDILGRLGGEEFVVVLPGATADETRVVAERVRRNIARMPIPAPEGKFSLTCSIGIADLEGATDTLEKAIHRADLALYRAKHDGRNRVMVYEPGM